jgi:hypothetical protein
MYDLLVCMTWDAQVMTQVRFQAQKPTILPTSARKITQSKMLFDR